MKLFFSKRALLIPLAFLISSCIIDPDLIVNIGKKPNSNSTESKLLIGGKTLKQQINLKIDKLSLEEFQEIDITNYIDLNSSILKPEQLLWTSKNSNIAIIDSQSGKLRAIKEGTTIITVSLKENLDIFVNISLEIIKKKIVNSIKIIPSSFILNIGDSRNLLAEVELNDGQINSNISWSSSDNTIATVNQNGKVSALKKGKVTIVATYNIDNSYKAFSILEIID